MTDPRKLADEPATRARTMPVDFWITSSSDKRSSVAPGSGATQGVRHSWRSKMRRISPLIAFHLPFHVHVNKRVTQTYMARVVFDGHALETPCPRPFGGNRARAGWAHVIYAGPS